MLQSLKYRYLKLFLIARFLLALGLVWIVLREPAYLAPASTTLVARADASNQRRILEKCINATASTHGFHAVRATSILPG